MPHARMFPGIFLLALTACSPSSGTAVSGTVKEKSQPLANAVVTFLPTGDTFGQGGHGVTDAEGKYTITGTRGEKGIAPGEYKVTVSLRLRPDGSLPDPNTPPIESDATERLLPEYWDRDRTKLKANVDTAGGTHDFTVERVK
jgi:hypothetical protein